MLEFFRTLFLILILRRGPEVLPRSQFLYLVALVLWFLPPCYMLLTEPEYDGLIFLQQVLPWVATWVAFSVVIIGTGYGERVLQSLTAIVGIGAIISYLHLSVAGLLGNFLPPEEIATLSFVIYLYAVVPKGVILARATELPLYLGIGVSFVIVLLREALLGIMVST